MGAVRVDTATPGADRFGIGLAALSMLSELAGDGALLALIDDAHWLDRASADALLFAARRLEADGRSGHAAATAWSTSTSTSSTPA